MSIASVRASSITVLLYDPNTALSFIAFHSASGSSTRSASTREGLSLSSSSPSPEPEPEEPAGSHQ
jgi:hypothetical protein